MTSFSFALSYTAYDHKGSEGDILSVISGGRYVPTAPSPVDMNVFPGLKFGVLLSGEDTEGVSTEVVTLSLEDVSGDNLTPVPVQEGQSCREGRGGNAP